MSVLAASIAINAASGSNASRAASAAREACKTYMANFHDAGSGVEAKQVYARCVYRVFGDGVPMSDGWVIIFKATVALAFIGFAIGSWISWRNERDVVFALLGGLLGVVGFPAFLWLGVGCIYSLRFLFS